MRARKILIPLLGGILWACGDDSGPAADKGTTPMDRGLTPDTKVVDGKAPPSDGPSGFFKIQGKISFDPKMCKALDKAADCKGPLIWGIWQKPLTDPNPGAPIFLSGVPAAQQGTTYGADKVPIAPKMFLSAFVDDNHNVTVQDPWPDKGDPLHVDLEPFTAASGATLTRDIGFWVRTP
jgi:hypothetical protein